jgi:hypothetical protein
MFARRPSVSIAGLVAATVIVGVTAGAVPSASAAAPVSQATGRFLSGAIGSTSLDKLAALNGESAVNTGGAAVTKQHSLSASLLGQQLLNLPNGVQLPGGGVLTLGAVNQYAQANSDGSSHGASGAITNSGAIGVGNGGAPQSNAMLRLGDLPSIPGINTGSVPSFAHLTASIGALAATADQSKGSHGAQVGHYEIATLKLSVDSPLLASTIKTLTSQLTGQLDQLTGAGLTVPALGTVGSCNAASLAKALAAFGDMSFGGGAITGSLTGGNLTVDVGRLLNALLHLDLNNLPPNTHLFEYLAKALPQALGSGLTQLQGTLTSVFDKLTNLTDNACAAPVKTLVDPVSKLGKAALGMLTKPLSSALGTGTTALTPLFVGLAKQLEQLIDPIVNVQEHNGGTFTERALQLNLVGDPAARINLASASVGPSQLAAVAPPSHPAPPTHSPAAPAPKHLASTGASVVLTKIALFGLLGVCLGTALFGATIGVRRRLRGRTS